jgi:hypothetical protein
MIVRVDDIGEVEMTAQTERLFKTATKADDDDHRFRMDVEVFVGGGMAELRLYITGKNWPSERNWQVGSLNLSVDELRSIVKIGEATA